MSSVKQETFNGVVWTSVEKFSNLGIHFVVGLVLARLLQPSDFGAIALLTIFYTISNSFIDSGFGSALVRKQGRTETDFSTVFYFNIFISIVCYAILYASAPLISDFFRLPILCLVLRVQAVNLIFNAFIAVLNAKLLISLDFKAIAIRTLLSALISGIVGITMAYLGYGIWSLVFQTLTATFVNLVFVWSYCRWIPLWTFSFQSFKELGSYGSKLLAAGLINTIYDNLSPLAIGKFYTPKDLGFYNRGAELARVPNQSMLSVVQSVSFPVFSKIQDDDAHLISVYRKYIKIASMFLIFSSILIAALAKPIILLLLTEKWSEAIIYLQLFCMAVMFNHINTINLNLLKVKGRSDLFLKLEIVKKTISTIILISAIPFGVLAICISKIFYTQIAIVINTYYSGKLFNMGYISQVKDFIGYFFLSVLACLPAYLVTFINIPFIVQILLGLLFGVSIYYYSLRKDVLLKEILNMIKNKIKK